MRLAAVLLLITLALLLWWTTKPADAHEPRERYKGFTVHQAVRALEKSNRRLRERGTVIVKLRRANRARISMSSPLSVVRGFHCIHTFEGSWTDSGAPHWGGLQMDRQFMRFYGGEFYRALGTADRWPPFVQLTVAMRAYYSGRGFYPWPNTARFCGLIR